MTRGDHFRDDDDLDTLVHPSRIKGQSRQRRQSLPTQQPRRISPNRLTELDESTISDDEFTMTYKPARFESGWLRASLRPFYEQELIDDVLAQVKGGKEANVYRCRGHAGAALALLAAKVYRPRQFRNLSNDALYREGRTIQDVEGHAIKANDNRVLRALRKKTVFGEEVKHASWVMHEHDVLTRLHAAGAAVPEPLAAAENAILMSYHGDGRTAAPTLNAVALEPAEAVAHFAEVLRNIEVMLANDLIHGDLSAYNILYWEGAITIIDFPQAVNCHSNPHAFALLGRDVTRVAGYFRQQGVATGDPAALTRELWLRVVGVPPDSPEREPRIAY